MPSSNQSVEDVAAVELAHRQQIECGDEESHPAGKSHRRECQLRGMDAGPQPVRQQHEAKRNARNDCIGRSAASSQPRVQHPPGERRNRQYEAGNRARYGNIQKHTPGENRRTDADEGPHGSNERWRGDEVRVAHAQAIMAAGEIVAQFVRQQDGEERTGEGQPRSEPTRVLKNAAERSKREVRAEGWAPGRVVCGDSRPSNHGAEGSHSKKK